MLYFTVLLIGLLAKSIRSTSSLISPNLKYIRYNFLLWFFELAPSKGTRGHRYELFKKSKGTLGQKFFSARVVDLWNELDDSTVSQFLKGSWENWVIKHFIVVCSGFNTDYGSSEPLKTLLMLC